MLGSVLLVMTVNVVDVGLLTVRQMQVDNAAEMAVQAVYSACNSFSAPASTTCATYSSKITTATQSTSLGSSITSTASEKNCCANAGGQLECQTYNASTTTCSFAGDATIAPGYYVEVQTSYGFTPMFGGISVVVASKTLTSTATIRVR